MPTKVAIVGVGHTTFRATSPGLSYKELMFEAATRAYADAAIDPRTDIDSFLTCSEDLAEGTSIFDEYVTDQIGAAQGPVSHGGAARHAARATPAAHSRSAGPCRRGGCSAPAARARPPPKAKPLTMATCRSTYPAARS